MNSPAKIYHGSHRPTKLVVAVTLILALASCSDSVETVLSNSTSSAESFLTIRATWDESSTLNDEDSDIATFLLSDKQIVPDVRVARINTSTKIGVYPTTRALEADYFGYPLTADGQFIVWSRAQDRDDVTLINPKTGSRTKLHSGFTFKNVSYFADLETVIVNSDFCVAVKPDGDVRRIGKGQCIGTSLGLQLLEQDASSITISQINETFQISDRRSFPIKDVQFSAGGALISGRVIGSSSLAVFELLNGRKLWTSKPTDFKADVLSSAKSGDSLLIAQDSDDNDNLVDLLSIRFDQAGSSIKKLLSSRVVAAQLSSDGTAVMIATKSDSQADYAYQTQNLLTGESSDLGYAGEPSGLALSSTDFYAFVSGGTLFVGTFGDEPRRALDIFGEVTGLVEITTESRFLVLTEDGGQTSITSVRETDSRPEAKLVLSVPGRLIFNPQLGSRQGTALLTAIDDDGYGTLYEVSLVNKFDPRRLAEGNIAWFSYGPDGNIFYGDVLNREMNVYVTKSADNPSRALVSTRYVIVRQGPAIIRETGSGFLREMRAYIDPTLELCKRQRLTRLTLAETSTELTLNEMGKGAPASLCIQVPLQLRGSPFDLSLSPVDAGTNTLYQFDSAFELLSSEVGDVDPVTTADSLDVISTADDSQIGTDRTFSYESRLSNQEFSQPTYLLRGYSWTGKTTAVLRIAKPTDKPVSSTNFSRNDWKNRSAAYEACKAQPSLVAGRGSEIEELDLTIGVDANGDAEIKQFCLSIPQASQDSRAEYTLYLVPDNTSGAIAQLALGCADLKARQTASGQPFGSLSSPRDVIGFENRDSRDVGTSRSTTIAVYQLTKGYAGPCYLTHQNPRPADVSAATRVKVQIAIAGPS